MTELFLDPNMRIFVHLGIALISSLICIIRGYVLDFVHQEASPDLKIIQWNQALKRAEVLRKIGHLLVPRSFLMRKHFFCGEKKGFFRLYENVDTKRKEEEDNKFMKDLRTLAEYCRNNLATVVPTILAGTWVHFTFDDLVSTKVPFFITRRFKSFLQNGIYVVDLDASWVSASSWYCMIFFGFPHIGKVLLSNGEEKASAMTVVPMEAAAEIKEAKKLFLNARENLEMYHHKWSLAEEFN